MKVALLQKENRFVILLFPDKKAAAEKRAAPRIAMRFLLRESRTFLYVKNNF